MLNYCIIETPLGQLLARSEQNTLIGLWFTTQKYFPESDENWIENDKIPVFVKTRDWLSSYFNGESKPLDIEIAPKGTEFQQLVWKYLMQIPFGQTTTYAAIAKSVAADMGRESMSAQAVGGAIGKNPLSIYVPCHRVIGSDKTLTGYAGGLDKKEALLKLEEGDGSLGFLRDTPVREIKK